LSYILVKKTYLKENEEGTALEMQSYLSKEEDSGKRDGMLKIGRLSQGFSVFKTFSSQDDFFEMIETSTPQTVLELDNCFEESRSTRRIFPPTRSSTASRPSRPTMPRSRPTTPLVSLGPWP